MQIVKQTRTVGLNLKNGLGAICIVNKVADMGDSGRLHTDLRINLPVFNPDLMLMEAIPAKFSWANKFTGREIYREDDDER